MRSIELHVLTAIYMMSNMMIKEIAILLFTCSSTHQFIHVFIYFSNLGMVVG